MVEVHCTLWIVASILTSVEIVEGNLNRPSVTTLPSTARDPREYCEAEDFAPQCNEDEVVMITEALYGRMELAHCVRMNYGEVGCKADVREHLDRECSGRRTCSLRIPDTSLDEANVCPREFKTYLNVTHKCIPVENLSCVACGRSSFARVTHQRAYIASAVTASSTHSSCGSARCPWLIEVLSGQTINITLFDFGMEQRQRAFTAPDTCTTRYAVIKEPSTTKDTPVCGGRSRERLIYSSIGNVVEIHVINAEVLKTRDYFMLYYEAIGCPDLDAPRNSWLKRTADKTTVGCKDDQQTWETLCIGNKWEGEIGTCPEKSESTTRVGTILSLPLGLRQQNGVLIAIVLGIALVIGVLIVTVGVVCLRRQHNEEFPRPETTLYVRADDGQCYELREDMMAVEHLRGGPKLIGTPLRGPKPGGSVPAGGQFRQVVHVPLGSGRENLYAHARMETRPLPSIPTNINEGPAVPCEAGGGGGGGGVSGVQRGLSFDGGAMSVPGGQCPYHTQVVVRPGGLGRGPAPPVPTKPQRGGSTVSAAAQQQSNIPALPLQHYTVLDPIDTNGSGAATGGPGTLGWGPAPPPSPPLPPWPAMDDGTVVHPARHASPAVGVTQSPPSGIQPARTTSPNSEEGHASCQEIALRPTRDGSQPKIDSASSGSAAGASGSGGNCSWP